MKAFSNRFDWAAHCLEIKPRQNILEIGCGTGQLAEGICSQLITGTYTGIDKSPAMIAKAEKRNAEFIKQGIAGFHQLDFKPAELNKQFHTIVAFNVPFFLQNSPLLIEKIKTLVEPGGKLFIFYQFPYDVDITAADPIRKTLEKSMTIAEVKIQKLDPVSAICIVATE